jgi:hypothetical protein
LRCSRAHRLDRGMAEGGRRWWCSRRKTTAQETPLPGFGSRCPGQELGAGGAHCRGAPFGPVGRHGCGSTVAGDGERRRWRQEAWLKRKQRASARRRKRKRLLHRRTHGSIRPRPPWVGGVDRQRWPLCRECGHRLVTGSAVSEAGPVTVAHG